MKHLISGTSFPGTFSFISSRQTGSLEGLVLRIYPGGSRLAAPAVSRLRLPLCQLNIQLI